MKLYQNAYNWILQNKYVIGILFFAACLRFPGFLHGLPTYPDADEPVIVSLAVNVLKGQINPHWFLHPSLYIYLNAFIIGCVHIVYHGLHALGFFSYDNTPYWLFFAACRFFNILLSLVTIVIVYNLTSLVKTRSAGIFAALVMAILPLHTMHTVRVVPNSITLCTTAFTIFFSLKYLGKKRRARWLYSAAFFSGLAIGAKYMFVAPVSFLLAKWFKDRKEGHQFFDTPLLLSLGIVIGVFILSTPFAVLSFREFIEIGPLTQNAIYRAGLTEYPFLFYLTSLFKSSTGASPFIFVLFVGGFIIHLKENYKESLIIFSIPLIWFLFCSFYGLTSMRQIIIMSIPIAVFTGIIIEKIPRLWIQLLLLVLLTISPMISNVRHLIDVRKPDIRYAAAEWINENLPTGSRIAREEYTPYCDNNKFDCTYIDICGLAFITPDTIRKKGYDYVVSASHDRFLRYPEKCAKEIENYNNILHEFEVIKEFNPGHKYRGSKIQIFKID